MRRQLPALLLFLLAPVIGEYLLGNLPLGSADALAVYLPLVFLYGAGAVIIRECTVRAGRGWPTLLLLALAYGVVEEGIITQSLFNPAYVGLELNAYGVIPGTQTGAPWALYVLTLHSVWSIVVPIVLVEVLFPGRRRQPWLPWPMLIPAGIVYLLGAALFGFGTYVQEDFLAGPGRLAVAAGIAVTLVLAAFLLPRRRTPNDATTRPGTPWRATVLGGIAFAAGSAFFLLFILGVSERMLPPYVHVAATLAVIIGFAVVVRINTARPGWSDAHLFALAAGGVLTYCWGGVVVQSSQYDYGPLTATVQFTLIAAAVTLLVHIGRRTRKPSTPRSPSTTPTR
ncbi:hypothetical protein [Catenuloplanes atrovinosus]|uniref:DUF998 domain-containing protein n=1 Tax=Catenuloplanes atrovinosus TaxID=137266 RepID=A0AAE3YKR9_9ACTN|nr:hypothetical protein [Catenuloplanes atrovinosus]MDR7275633.1 hypothetical protein [Catenuloplanes atrovinosus]